MRPVGALESSWGKQRYVSHMLKALPDRLNIVSFKYLDVILFLFQLYSYSTIKSASVIKYLCIWHVMKRNRNKKSKSSSLKVRVAGEKLLDE